MATRTRISVLEEQERLARMRLAAYRSNLHNRGASDPATIHRRQREFERGWSGAADRLRRARKNAA